MKTNYPYLLFAALILAAVPLAHAEESANWKFQEGVHYQRLVPAQGTSSPPDKIEVAEFFSYGCPFCYRMDPYVEDWRKKQAEDVNFVPVPSVGDPVQEVHARLFLALEATGVLEKAHRGAFRAIHAEQRLLLTPGDQERFAKRHGVSGEDFRKAYRSFGVESELKRIRDLMRRYWVLAVPTFVVNGRYVVRGTQGSTYAGMLEIVDELVERERAE